MGNSKGYPLVLLFSHGKTLLTGENSHVREFWQYHGSKAIEYGIKGIIIKVIFLNLRSSVKHVRELTLRYKELTGASTGAKFMYPRIQIPKFNPLRW